MHERYSIFRICLGSSRRTVLDRGVQIRRSDSGEFRGQQEIESIAKECLALAIGEGHEGEVKDLKPDLINESRAQMLKKVQQLLTRPDSIVYLVE